MNIEKEIFKRSIPNYHKIEKYGFKKDNLIYIYEKIFFDNKFKAIIKIDENGEIIGKVIDLQINDEYLGIRTNMNGEFVSKVREAYKELLIDIKNKCFDTNYFVFDQTNRISNYIENKYGCTKEFLWEKFPSFAVYLNS